MIIVGNDSGKVQEIKIHIDERFSTKYLGVLKYFLGIEVAQKLENNDKSHKLDASLYRMLVGILVCLQDTRSGISYGVNILSQFVADPGKSHMDAACRVLCYLNTTPRKQILFPK